MPIEIKELHIQVNVASAPSSAAASQARSGGSKSGTDNSGSGSAKDAIIAECVEQVLQILQNKMER